MQFWKTNIGPICVQCSIIRKVNIHNLLHFIFASRHWFSHNVLDPKNVRVHFLIQRCKNYYVVLLTVHWWTSSFFMRQCYVHWKTYSECWSYTICETETYVWDGNGEICWKRFAVLTVFDVSLIAKIFTNVYHSVYLVYLLLSAALNSKHVCQFF